MDFPQVSNPRIRRYETPLPLKRYQATQAHRQSDMQRQRPHEHLWLDILPDLAVERIAEYVLVGAIAGTWNEAAINLAAVSVKQRAAVCFVSKPYVTVSKRISDVSLLGLKGLRNLHIKSASSAFALFNHPDVDFSEIQDVRIDGPYHTWYIWEYEDLYDTLKKATNLRSLNIDSYKLYSRVRLMFLLKHSNLQEITLRCSDKCVCDEGLRNEQNCYPQHVLRALKRYCANVETLNINCAKSTSRLLPVVQAFPALRKISVSCAEEMPTDLIAALQDVQNVEMRNQSLVQECRAVRLAPLVGLTVTSIRDEGVVNAEDLERLQVCTRLESLSVRIRADSEIRLLPLSQGLRELALTWVSDSWDQNESYHKVEPGLLLRIVKAAPDLSSLSLRKVILSDTELTTIMKHIGPRLQRFSLKMHLEEDVSQNAPSIDATPEEVAVIRKKRTTLRRTMAAIMDTAMKHNRNLAELKLEDGEAKLMYEQHLPLEESCLDDPLNFHEVSHDFLLAFPTLFDNDFYNMVREVASVSQDEG